MSSERTTNFLNSSQPEVKDVSEQKSLKEKGHLGTESERLPPIDDKKIQLTWKTIARKAEKSDSESSKDWLRPGVSLPKLQSKKNTISSEGENVFPIPSEETVPNLRKIASDCSRTLDHCCHSLIFSNEMQTVSDSTEFYGVDGPSKCRLSFEIPPDEINYYDFPILNDKPEEESHALKNWKLWTDRRKHTQDYLRKKVDKPVCDLALNQMYNFRKDQRPSTSPESEVRDPQTANQSHSQSGENSEKQRANTSHVTLKKGVLYATMKVVEEKELLFYYRKQEQEKKHLKLYHPTRSKKDSAKNDKCRVEFIEMPSAIKKEQNIFCLEEKRSRNAYGNLLREKIQKIKPKKKENHFYSHKVEMEDLVVIGETIPLNFSNSTRASFENLPKICLTESTEPVQDDRKSIFCLVIGGIEIKYEFNADCHRDPEINENPSWEVKFGLNKVGKIYEEAVEVENRGTLAVHYEWTIKEPEEKQSLNPLRGKLREPWFYFNKNSGIFVPGQKCELKFYQHPKECGIRIETWYLKTTPPMFSSGELAKFTLTSVATNDFLDDGIKFVENYLEKRVGATIVRILLENLISLAVRPDLNLNHIEYRSLLSEKDLFEFHNPQHYYHSDIVKELKQLFQELSYEHQNEWDLSLDSLLKIVRKCVTEKKSKEFLLRKISDCAHRSLRPCRVIIHGDQKYRMAYQVLCTAVSYFEEDYEYHRICFDEYPEYKHIKFDCIELEETDSNLSLKSEGGESDPRFEIKLVKMRGNNLIRFYEMVYLKVYQRLCLAVEQVAGIVETRKFLEPWKKI